MCVGPIKFAVFAGSIKSVVCVCVFLCTYDYAYQSVVLSKPLKVCGVPLPDIRYPVTIPSPFDTITASWGSSTHSVSHYVLC